MRTSSGITEDDNKLVTEFNELKISGGAPSGKGDYNRQCKQVTNLPLYTTVAFDLETTGLKEAEITQIAMTTEEGQFETFVMPNKPIEKAAERITGISIKDNKMFFQGKEVPFLSLKEALSKTVDYLKTLKNPILIAHNGKRFDFPIFFRSFAATNQMQELKSVCQMFGDTLLFFRSYKPGLKSYKQENLVRELLGESYDAHDAREDVKALLKLINTVPPEDMGKLYASFFSKEAILEASPRR